MRELYQDANMLYRRADSDDDKALREMLSQNSMDSWVNLSFEREPSYFDAHNIMGESYTMVAVDTNTNSYVGMYTCTYMDMYLNGDVQEVAYLRELRLNEKYRNKIRILKNGYKSLHTLLPKKEIEPLYITSVASQNSKARKVLEAGLKGMPTYTPLAKMNTLIFSSDFTPEQKKLKQATKQDVTRIAKFYKSFISSYQFAPHISEQWLSELPAKTGLSIGDFYIVEDGSGNIETCLALWDQRAFKQSVIKGYKPPLCQLRPLYNLFAKLSTRVLLPQVNSMLEQIYIAFFACTNDELQLDAIKEAAQIAKSKGASSCILGLSSEHPSVDVLKKKLKADVYETDIEMVNLDGKEATLMLDKERLIQPEVALL